jgi:outer membrane lipoprotein SlyB
MLQTPVTLSPPSATTRRTLKERSGLSFRLLISALILAGVSGCGPTYSPDTYASNAAQQANKVEQGVVVGVRTVGVSAAGTVGTVTGAAAGGIAGSQAIGGPVSAFTALGGALVGGIAGSTVEHATADTMAFEYIVRKPNGDLVSVTQKDKTPLALGQHVLVIAGNQARVVPDYTVPPSIKAAEAAKAPEAVRAPDPAKVPEPAAPDAKPAEAPGTVAAPDDKSAAPGKVPGGVTP